MSFILLAFSPQAKYRQLVLLGVTRSRNCGLFRGWVSRENPRAFPWASCFVTQELEGWEKDRSVVNPQSRGERSNRMQRIRSSSPMQPSGHLAKCGAIEGNKDSSRVSCRR